MICMEPGVPVTLADGGVTASTEAGSRGKGVAAGIGSSAGWAKASCVNITVIAMAQKTLGPGLRRGDDRCLPVIPAQAGIQWRAFVIPAQAGIQWRSFVIPAKAGIQCRWNLRVLTAPA
jgi:hypothetical protein